MDLVLPLGKMLQNHEIPAVRNFRALVVMHEPVIAGIHPELLTLVRSSNGSGWKFGTAPGYAESKYVRHLGFVFALPD